MSLLFHFIFLIFSLSFFLISCSLNRATYFESLFTPLFNAQQDEIYLEELINNNRTKKDEKQVSAAWERVRQTPNTHNIKNQSQTQQSQLNVPQVAQAEHCVIENTTTEQITSQTTPSTLTVDTISIQNKSNYVIPDNIQHELHSNTYTIAHPLEHKTQYKITPHDSRKYSRIQSLLNKYTCDELVVTPEIFLNILERFV